MAKILSGKTVSARVKQELKIEAENLTKAGTKPGLAVVIVGDDSASKVYVANKEKACAELGIYSEKYALSADTTEDELLNLIKKLNADDKIHGILVQLPLPKHLDDKTIINNILPSKDVDAFHPTNVGRIMIGDFDFVPCTPAGIIELLKRSGIKIDGRECVVIGRSNIVGKPMAMLLLRENGTVTVCHSHTVGLKEVTRRADILVAAIGKPEFITHEYVKEGAVVIDVGIHRLGTNENGKSILCGDVDYDDVYPHVSAITPVPGGVGPMTIAMLMNNCVNSVEVNKAE